MKKVLFLFVLSLALFSCKQKSSTEGDAGKDTTAVDTTAVDNVSADTTANVQSFAKIDQLDCSYYLPLRSLSVEQQLKWLDTHADDICNEEDYLKCMVKHHTITKEEYDAAITGFWGTTTPVYSTFDYSEFSNEECGFDKYYTFKADASHAISHELKVFDVAAHCYSKPFFRGIPLVFTAVTPTHDLIFTEAKINGQNVIVFKIDGVADAYFDFSHKPCGSIN
jgi:hypothetical protein